VTQPTVNVGVIGCGAFMARQHLPNILRHPNIRIHTLCDLDETLLAQRQQQFQPEACTTNADDVFANPDINAVLVGTRSTEHARFVLAAAAAGKAVYVEKPMTMTFAQTDQVLRAAQRSGITIGVGFNRRFAPSMVAARELFHQYKQGPANVSYRIVDDHRIRPEYIFDMNDGGGHLLQEGCHIFDLLAWFLDEEPVEIYAAGPLETDNVVVIRFQDDSLATVVCGGKGGQMYPKEAMEVFCNAHTLVVDHFYELRVDGPGRNFIRRFPLKPTSPVQPDQQTMTAFFETQFRARPAHDVVGAHAANTIPVPAVDKGHAQAMTAFAVAVVDGTPFAPDAIAGARATVCALKAYESIRTNRPQPIVFSDDGATATAEHTMR